MARLARCTSKGLSEGGTVTTVVCSLGVHLQGQAAMPSQARDVILLGAWVLNSQESWRLGVAVLLARCRDKIALVCPNCGARVHYPKPVLVDLGFIDGMPGAGDDAFLIWFPAGAGQQNEFANGAAGVSNRVCHSVLFRRPGWRRGRQEQGNAAAPTSIMCDSCSVRLSRRCCRSSNTSLRLVPASHSLESKKARKKKTNVAATSTPRAQG